MLFFTENFVHRQYKRIKKTRTVTNGKNISSTQGIKFLDFIPLNFIRFEKKKKLFEDLVTFRPISCFFFLCFVIQCCHSNGANGIQQK